MSRFTKFFFPGVDRDETRVIERYSPPSWLLKGFFVFAGCLFLAEFVIIFFVLTPENVQRLQGLHGSWVMIGGLVWAVLATFVIMLPLKFMSARGVLASEQAQVEFRKSVQDLKAELKQDIKEAREELKDAAANLRKLADAFHKPIAKPPLPPEALRDGTGGEKESVPAADRSHNSSG